MDTKEAQNCWEFMNCDTDVREKCPAYTTNSGRECWLVAGSFNKFPSCPKVVKKIMHCWECPWYKKLNPEAEK